MIRPMQIIETPRLILRTWTDADLEPMCAINQDHQVMKHFPSLLSIDETTALVERINRHWDKHGYTLYAVQLKSTNAFIGFVGLLTVDFDAHFTPAIEIGWRLAAAYWDQGYATEAAAAVLDHGFTELKLPEIVSFTTICNIKSQRVMQKISLKHNATDNFIYPKIDANNPLSNAVLYRITKDQYLATKKLATLWNLTNIQAINNNFSHMCD